MYKRFVKRWLDIALTLLALLFFWWAFAILAVLVRVKLGSPVIFRQMRPGKDEKAFTLYKFRSMTDARDKTGNLLPDKERLTRFGRILRATSLDELPEIWNILKGDMSIVGPRPWAFSDLKYYSDAERVRFQMRPGLTGWAQVNGRNAASWPERIRHDVEYAEKVSPWFDIKILWLSVMKVLKRADIVVRGEGGARDFGLYRTIEEETMKTSDILPSQEIGSFFELESGEKEENLEPVAWLPQGEDCTYTFSGRDAIMFALKDILKEKKVKTAYLPSYCCVTMVEPFLSHGIQVEFYDVRYACGLQFDIDPEKSCDVFFAMQYFGFRHDQMDEAIEAFHARGVTVIEDVTHSLLNPIPCAKESDYVVASLRKWFAVPTGGYLMKREGALSARPTKNGDSGVAERLEAMELKRKYLSGEAVEKELFLEKNQRYETSLNYVHELNIDRISAGVLRAIDVEHVAEQRRKNAKVLYDALAETDGIVPIFEESELETACPLFVPVMLENESRNSLREHLIRNGIYCPVHWPEVMGTKPGPRRNELSLICDQRYNEEDMARIVEQIKAWADDFAEKAVPIETQPLG